MVVSRWVSSLLKIWTMWRFDGESNNFITYLPGGSTLLGTWIDSLTVKIVFLFHSSARALGVSATPSSPTDATARTKLFMLKTPSLFRNLPIRDPRQSSRRI